jgi:hypothetical protein
MNDTSKYLHHFLETTLLKEIDVPAFSFSEDSIPIIKTLYTYLLESAQAWRMCLKRAHPERRIEHLSPILFSPEMFSGINYNYIPKEIRAGLEQSKKHGYQTTFYFPSRTIHIYMVFPKNAKNTKKMDSKSKRECTNYIRKIFMWLYIAEKYASNKCSRVINLYFYMTNHLKTLPDVVQEPIHMIHVNTAFTLPCSEITYMYLFRSEEWFKVFIHETFHNFGLDFSKMDQELAEKRILSRFPLSISDIRIFESYCETWAQTINTLFISYWSETKPFVSRKSTNKRYSQINTTKKAKKAFSLNDPSFSKIRVKMESLLGKEQLFSIFQCIKVLNHFDLTYDDIYKTDQHPVNTLKIRNYQENTNVFSYYVLKTILFFHLNDFLGWCKQNNENVLDFRKTEGSLLKYIKLIESLYADPEYTLLFKKMTEWYQQRMTGGYDQSERSPHYFAFKTLRMTSSESA